nr:hypothetical protein [Tanacetum cinerariifolium]
MNPNNDMSDFYNYYLNSIWIELQLKQQKIKKQEKKKKHDAEKAKEDLRKDVSEKKDVINIVPKTNCKRNAQRLSPFTFTSGHVLIQSNTSFHFFKFCTLGPAGGNGVTAAPEVRTKGKAAEEVRCSSGSPGQNNSSPGAGNKKLGSTTGDRGRYEEGRRRQECWAKPRIRRYACPVLGSSGEQRASILAGCYPTRAATDAPGAGQAEEVSATDPPAATKSCKRGRDGTDVNAPPKSLRRDHADPRPTGSAHGGKSLAAIQLGLASTPVPVPENAPASVSDRDPLSFADLPSRHPADIAQSSQGTAAAGDPDSENASSPVEIGSPESIYRPEWSLGPAGGNGVTAAPEVRTKGKAAEEVRCSSGSPGQNNSSPGAGNKKLRSTTGDRGRYEEGRRRQECWAKPRIRRYACPVLGSSGEQRASIQAEMEARLDALSIDFDEELYPYMLTAIAGRRWVIGRGLRLTVMKCGESLELRQAFTDVVSAGIAKGLSEGLRHGVEHGQAHLSLESIEAYDPEAEAKFVAALQALKDLKYPLVDQLEGLKDAPMDVIMVALYLESDIGDDAPQYIRDLRPSSSQLTIHVYPEVRDPQNPWACKEEMVLADAIAANISRAKKKKKCRIVCRTHGVGSAHHARFDGVPVFVPTVVPQGLVLLLADAATQTKLEEAT